MKHLSKIFRDAKKIAPTSAFSQNSKRRIFQRIEQQESFWVIRLLENILKPVPDLQFIQQARMRFFEKTQQRDLWSVMASWFHTVRRPMSFITAFCFIIVVVTVPRTSARSENYLQVVEGKVEVSFAYSHQWEPVAQSLSLHKGDKIRTFDNSVAEIYLSNQSVVRLAENTQLSISHLLHDKYLSEFPVLVLQEGRVWTNIQRTTLLPLTIETRHSRVSSDYGVFDIEAGAHTRVRAIKNEVLVEHRQDLSAKPFPLKAGFESNLRTSQKEVIVVKKLISDNWAEKNIEKDEVYRQKIIQEDAEATEVLASVLPDSLLYPLVEKYNDFGQQDQFFHIQRTFAVAKVFLTQGKEEKSQKAFMQAETDLANYWTQSLDTESDQKKILSYIDEEKSLFSHVVPGDDLYPLRSSFEELFVLYASSPQMEKEKQLEERRVEIASLSISENEDASEILLESIETLMLKNKEIFIDADHMKKEDLHRLLDIQNQNLKALELAKNQISNKEVGKKIKESQREIVQSINNIVAQISPQKNVVKVKKVKQKDAEWFSSQIIVMVERVERYSSKNSRKNTIHWILSEIQNKPASLPFLLSLKESMPEDVRIDVLQKIMIIQAAERKL
ncbi:hypothetical protein COB57_03935 [Candidatus Peregrinibacteria bacterium]|nr:MAG: hypothetical protein COB57_03935 [Candidatus Peregrinibacteria bacterium]